MFRTLVGFLLSKFKENTPAYVLIVVLALAAVYASSTFAIPTKEELRRVKETQGRVENLDLARVRADDKIESIREDLREVKETLREIERLLRHRESKKEQ